MHLCYVGALETSAPTKVSIRENLKSVGVYLSRKFCVFREFRGNIPWQK